MLDMVNHNDSDIGRQALAKLADIEARKLRRVYEDAEAKRAWHLVQIAQPQFARASSHLIDAGYTLYAPMERDFVVPRSNTLPLGLRKNRHLLKREKLTPYFGSYRFIRFDAAVDPWHDLFKLAGVHGIGVANGMPVPLPDALIERLRAEEVNGAIPASVSVKALIFSIGDTARVKDGPFSGFTGKVERIDESGRIRLLLELFAGLTPVDMTADEVDKVDAPKSKAGVSGWNHTKNHT